MSSSLPIGWGDRHNTMSEKDMQLGGAAAARFASKSAYADDTSGIYKNSDDVRKHYYDLTSQQQQQQQQQQQPDEKDKASALDGVESTTTTPLASSSSSSSPLPPLWVDRQKEREIQAKQYGAFSRNTAASLPTTNDIGAANHHHHPVAVSAQVALLRVATHTLQTLAVTLTSSSSSSADTTTTTNKIPLEEKEAFANVIRQAMEAMAKFS